ncbi:MAG TPA: DUF5947 family protein [Bryobacteraceae bacterium]|nr:DUF5947 family protein [Bryobacteraceae bacterium]
MTPSAPLRTLRRFLPAKRAARCELCGADLAAEHGHLLETAARRLVCACEACGVLFAHRGAGGYRRLPRRVRWLPDFCLTDAEWEALGIPIGLAFFVPHSATGRVAAYYPGPAGPVESLLGLESWAGVAARNPVLTELEPDVEALLANRIGGAREYCTAPVDRCYELCGLIRMHWRGLSGGEEMWREIAAFFARLREAGRA